MAATSRPRECMDTVTAWWPISIHCRALFFAQRTHKLLHILSAIKIVRLSKVASYGMNLTSGVTSTPACFNSDMTFVIAVLNSPSIASFMSVIFDGGCVKSMPVGVSS